jgi:TolA-binding protein
MTAGDPEVQRDLGSLTAQVQDLNQRLDRLELLQDQRHASNALTLQRIETTLDEVKEIKGAWKMIATISTAAGAAGGVAISKLSAILPFLR